VLGGALALAAVAVQAAPRRLLCVSDGKTLLVNADGSGQRALDLQAPGQATWQAAGILPGGRALMLSLAPAKFGPDRPYDRFYWQTRTRIWSYDPTADRLTELATQNRLADFYTPQALLPEDRVLMQVAREAGVQVYSMKLDGSDAREFTKLGEGVPYGFSVSPDASRVAFHLAGEGGYRIFTSRPDGSDRKLVAGDAGHLYFGPSWSPDGRSLVYEDCIPAQEPGHDWCDARLSAADGSGSHRSLTQGRSLWFGATYGSPKRRGGGSNLLAWLSESEIVAPRRMPASRVAWVFQPNRPDTDHFNRDYLRDQAYGGTHICRIDAESGKWSAVTPAKLDRWDFRATPSPDRSMIAFCRAGTGEMPELWVMTAQGHSARRISTGIDGAGCDHPRWLI
jgi:TolB protein